MVTELDVSGLLHNSDLVMYDRYEGSLWQQVTGEAIVGPAAQRYEQLEQIPIITTSWSAWKSQYPETEVLAREPGVRGYEMYPYGTYEENDEIYFGVEGLDTSLQIKTEVYGIGLGDASKAYPASISDDIETISDSVNGEQLILTRNNDSSITVIFSSGEDIIPIRLFWFAWAAFHPDTEMYQK